MYRLAPRDGSETQTTPRRTDSVQGVRGAGQAGLGQRGRTRTAIHETRERVGHGAQPRIGLLRQLCRMNLGQRRCRQALQKGARQSLRNQAERRVLVVTRLVGRHTRHQPAGSAAQKMLRRRLLRPVS